MSLAGFQTALAAIIRCPEAHRASDLESFLKPYPLTLVEKQTIRQLSLHPELNKYGEEQAEQRWDMILRNCPRLVRVAKKETLRQIAMELFECTAMTVESDLDGRAKYSRAFLSFLLNSPQAREILSLQLPPFIFDLLKMEQAEIELSCRRLESPQLKPESLLTNPHFRIVELDHDISSLLALPLDELKSWKKKKLSVPQTPITMLLIQPGNMAAVRAFQIDADTKNLLLAQRIDSEFKRSFTVEQEKCFRSVSLI